MGRDSDGAQFHVGQVCKHRKYGYNFVIFGWHKSCRMSENWIQSMGVDHLPRGRVQPFYHCLADVSHRPHETSITYVAEDNVEPTDAIAPVQHPMVEQVFSHFVPGAGYLPTASLRSEYPDDLLPSLAEDNYVHNYRTMARTKQRQAEVEAAAQKRARDRVAAEQLRVAMEAASRTTGEASTKHGGSAGQQLGTVHSLGSSQHPGHDASSAQDGADARSTSATEAAPGQRVRPTGPPPVLDSKTAGSVMLATGGGGVATVSIIDDARGSRLAGASSGGVSSSSGAASGGHATSR